MSVDKNKFLLFLISKFFMLLALMMRHQCSDYVRTKRERVFATSFCSRYSGSHVLVESSGIRSGELKCAVAPRALSNDD